MEDRPSRNQPDAHGDVDNGRDDAVRPLRRILIAAGLVLVVLILIAVAVYAVAFVILGPMMQ